MKRRPFVVGAGGRSLVRWFSRFVCVLFTLIGLTPVVLALAAQSPMVQQWVSQELARAVRNELGWDVSLRASASIFSFRFAANDIVVLSQDGGAPALSAEGVTLQPRLFSLLSGKFVVHEIEADKPHVRLVVNRGSLENLKLPAPKKDTTKPTEFSIGAVVVNDATVDLTLDGVRVASSAIDVDVAARNRGSYDIALRLGPTSIVQVAERTDKTREAVHEDRLCQLELRATLGEEGVVLRRLQLDGVADSDSSVNTLPQCEGTSPHRFGASVELARVAWAGGVLQGAGGAVHAWAPLQVLQRYSSIPNIRGRLDVRGDGTWTQGQRLPDLRLVITGEDVGLDVYTFAKTLSLDAVSDGQSIRVPHALVGFADGNVRIENFRIDPFVKGVPLRADRIRITGLEFPGLMRDLGVTEHTHVAMHFREGTLSSVEGTVDPLHINSNLSTDLEGFEVFDAAFDDPARGHVIGVDKAHVNARFGVRPQAVVFENGEATFGGSKLLVSTSLGFDNQFSLSVGKSSLLELQDVSPLLDLPWAGRAELTTRISGTFSDPLIEGDLSVQNFMFAEMDLADQFSTKARFRPMILDLDQVLALKGQSSYASPRVQLNFTGPAPMTMIASVVSEHLDIRDFLSVFRYTNDPRFERLHGVLQVQGDVEYDIGTARDRCGGGWLGIQAQGQVKQAELFGEAYDGGAFDFSYVWEDPQAQEAGVRADFRSVVLNKGAGRILGSASIRPGGILRARAIGSTLPLKKLQSLGLARMLLDGSVGLTADVDGTLDRMRVQLAGEVSPIAIGAVTVPGSKFAVRLTPVDPVVQVVGRSKCGNLISAPFDPVRYAKDLPSGLFEVSANLLGGQIKTKNLQITQQHHQVVSGDLELARLDLGKLTALVPIWANDPTRPSGTMTGRIQLDHLPLDSMSEARLGVDISQLSVIHRGRSLSLLEGTQQLVVENDTLRIPKVKFGFSLPEGMQGTLLLQGSVSQLSAQPQLDLAASLPETDLSSLSNGFPRLESARGVVSAAIGIQGPAADPRLFGSATLSGGAVSLRGLSDPIDEIELLVKLEGQELRLEKASAKLGGGRIRASGTLPMHELELGTATGILTARDVSLKLGDGVVMTADADLGATWNADLGQDVVSLPRVFGDINVQSLRYERPFRIEADIGSLANRARKTEFRLYDPQKEFVEIDLRVSANQAIRIRNDLTEMALAIDGPPLQLAGTNERLGMRGTLRVLPDSRLRLRNSEFEVREGSVRFEDLTAIEPTIDVTAVTEYVRYSNSSSDAKSLDSMLPTGGRWRIQLHAHGNTENLKLDLTSEPTLSQEDIVLLLSFGVTRAEMQGSSVGESAALEALSTLTGADSVVRESFPVIDDFHLGSSYSSRSGRTEPTVTVGKRLTDRVRASVTSGVTENREVRSALEWELTRATSVLGNYDNVNGVSNSTLGNLGADIRFRIVFE